MKHLKQSARNIALLLFSSRTLLVALPAALTLTAFGLIIRYPIDGDNIPEPTQTVIISLTTTLYAYIVGLFIGVMYTYKEYANIAGTYDGYAYMDEEDERNEDFYKIQDEPQSVAMLEYVGGSDFRIQVSVKYPPELDDLVWVGDLKMTSSNTASIGWWYTNERLKYEIGNKRAVIIEKKIVLFADGKSNHRREVFIKCRD